MASTKVPIIKRLLSLILVDVILLSLLVWCIDATLDLSIIELIIVPAIFTVHILSALAAYFFKRKMLSRFLVINALIASVTFHFLFQLWFVYWNNKNFRQYNFKLNARVYSLTLDKRDTSYSLYERGKGSSIEYKRGRYEFSHDSILLLDSTKRLIIINDNLIGFPNAADTAHLTKR